MTDLAGELRLAFQLADAADAITVPYYEQRSFHLDWKENHTEVTEADRRAEEAISEIVLAERPDHGLFGEEHGLVGNDGSPYRWVIDPIDGTSNFVRGIPVWATLIALTVAGDGPVVGVVSCPAMGRRWWAAKGMGSFASNATGGARPCRVSTIADIADAQVTITASPGWDALGKNDGLIALQQRAHRTRGFGDFWQHMLVAEGAVDLAIDAIGVQPYDLAAPMIVVEEAGGRFTDRHGERTYEHDSCVTSNGLLHHEAAFLGD